MMCEISGCFVFCIDGAQAVIRCRVTGRERPKNIIINAFAYVPEGKRQRVLFSVNGGKIYDFLFEGVQSYRDLIVPIESWGDNELEVKIYLNDAKSPRELGLSADSRELGLNIKRISLD